MLWTYRMIWKQESGSLGVKEPRRGRHQGPSCLKESPTELLIPRPAHEFAFIIFIFLWVFLSLSLCSSEDDLWKSLFSFYHVGPRDGAQALSCPYLESHPTGPCSGGFRSPVPPLWWTVKDQTMGLYTFLHKSTFWADRLFSSPSLSLLALESLMLENKNPKQFCSSHVTTGLVVWAGN